MSDELHRAGHVVLEVWRSAPGSVAGCRLRCTCGWRTGESPLGEGLSVLREAHLSPSIDTVVNFESCAIGREIRVEVHNSKAQATRMVGRPAPAPDDDDPTLVTAAHPGLPFSDFSGDDRTVVVAVPPDWLAALNRAADGQGDG